MMTKLRHVLFILLDMLEVVTPKGQHTRLRWYHKSPVYIVNGEATILPNTRRVGERVHLDIVQMPNPKAMAKRSTRRVEYNWLIHDLAHGQALLAVPAIDLDNDDTVTVRLPKGLKKGSGRSAYGCNEFPNQYWAEDGPCGKAPSEATIWLTMDDAYFVNCPIHVGL